MAHPPDKTSDLPQDWTENFDREANALTAKISLGLASKRETETLEEFEERAIQTFRDKGLFKNEKKKTR